MESPWFTTSYLCHYKNNPVVTVYTDKVEYNIEYKLQTMNKKQKTRVSLIVLVALFFTVMYCCKQQRITNENNRIIDEYRELGI